MRVSCPTFPQTTAILRAFFDAYADASGIAWVDANRSVCTVPLFSIADILSSPEIPQITQESFAGDDVLLIGPVYSNTYGMVLCFAAAVYMPEGTHNGFVCMPHIPALMLNDTPGTPYFKDTGYELWIINANGTYLYHPDAGFIGGNVYTFVLCRNTPSVAEGVSCDCRTS